MSPIRPRQDSYLSRMLPLVRGMHTAIAGLTIASVLAGLSEAVILAIVAQAAGALVNGARSVHITLGPSHLNESLGILLGAAATLALVRLALQVPLAVIPARLSADVQARMQRSLFNAFTRASWSEQSRAREGYLQELVTNQVLQAAWSMLGATALVTSALTLVVLIVSALLLNVVAALGVLGTTIVLFVLLRPLNTHLVRLSRALSKAQMDMASGVGQAARLAEETHVFGVSGAQRRSMNELVWSAREPFYRAQMLARFTPGIYQSMIYLLVIGGLSLLYSTHSIHVASIGAVVLLLIRAGTYGQQVQSLYQNIRQTMPFVERVQEMERRYEASAPPSGGRPLREIARLRFKDVAFAYTGDGSVLSDINFDVSRGEAIGIIGPSGAGKSTIVQILLQLRPPSSGLFLVNDVPGPELVRDDWYARVSYVPQEPRLLHASVADNIRFYRDLDDDVVREAARLARIDADIESWANGYETIVGPRADAVSGGQQQRICIARALAGEPELLILDEPTSALDPNSESLLQESLRALRHRLTLFVVAHRMSTLDICSRVMVIVDGRLVDFDTPARLSDHSSYYRSAWALATGAATADGTDRSSSHAQSIVA